MKDIPVFDTETGVSTLVLKEVPYKQVAYVTVRSVQPGGLGEHLKECAAFCRMCGAEIVLATGHPELEDLPIYCKVLVMGTDPADWAAPGRLEPVTAETVGRWREIYNDRMRPVDDAATLTARDEKRIVSSGGAYFVSDGDTHLGIGWVEGEKLLAVASVVPGAGEKVLRSLMTLSWAGMTLDVASTNARAIALYERLGFTVKGTRTVWYRIR